MASSSGKLPPDLLAVGKLIELQPPDVRELFQYALAMVMVEQGKARILERHATEAGELYTLSTAGGETIYLNHASTGPLPQRAVTALDEWSRLRANPSRISQELQFDTLDRADGDVLPEVPGCVFVVARRLVVRRPGIELSECASHLSLPESASSGSVPIRR